MNERIFDMARQSGATDENGGRAEHVFCFTKTELKGFAELIVRECAMWMSDGNIPDGFYEAGRMLEHFGVSE